MPERRRVYLAVFGVLMVLTGATIGAAMVDLGRLNAATALAIAVVKAILVVLFFMHVRHSGRLTRLVITGGLVWLVILLGLTMSDYLTRAPAGVAPF
jgi:cytochrome c oxidase subunit 4